MTRRDAFYATLHWILDNLAYVFLVASILAVRVVAPSWGWWLLFVGFFAVMAGVVWVVGTGAVGR